MDANYALLACLFIPVVALFLGWLAVNWPERGCTGSYFPKDDRRRGFAVIRKGFSFIEVLFAVMILGVGLVMVAGIFPVVAIQARSTAEESSASQSAKSATSLTESTFLGGDSRVLTLIPLTYRPPLLPVTGISAADQAGRLQQLPAEAWQYMRGNLIQPSNPKYATTVLYRRNGDPANQKTWAPVAQMFFIPIASRNTPIYTTDPVGGNAIAPFTGIVAEVQARPISVVIQNNPNGDGIDLVTVNDTTLVGATGAVGSGAYILIADDKITAAGVTGYMNGRIYRVGSPRTDIGVNVWELAPGFDFTPDNGPDGLSGNADDIFAIGSTTATAPSTVVASGPADAFVVGKGFIDVKNTPTSSDGYGGSTRDVSAFTTWIQCF